MIHLNRSFPLDLQFSLQTCHKNLVLLEKNSTDLQSGFDMDRIFFDLPRIRFEMAWSMAGMGAHWECTHAAHSLTDFFPKNTWKTHKNASWAFWETLEEVHGAVRGGKIKPSKTGPKTNDRKPCVSTLAFLDLQTRCVSSDWNVIISGGTGLCWHWSGVLLHSLWNSHLSVVSKAPSHTLDF